MRFQLDPELSISKALSTVALTELDIAHVALASCDNRHAGVHNARKCFKRLRALLALARPGMPEPVYAALSSQIARIGKGLAVARDARALLDAIGSLERNTLPGLGGSTINALRAWLKERCVAAERSLEQRSAAEALQMLLDLRPRLARLAIYPDDFTPLSKGLEIRYRDARRRFEAAFSSKNADELHDWRKGVQQHWRHMQLLTPCRPSELGARAKAARELSQILGDDHDITNLMRLASTPTMSFGEPEDLAGFRRRCKTRLKVLRSDAKAGGEKLFVEKPKRFVGRVHSYWAIASAKANEPLPLKPALDNVVEIDAARSEFGTKIERTGSG